MAPNSDEQLNYFKFASLVLNEFPNVLQQVFASMWDNKIASTFGCQKLEDSTPCRTIVLGRKGIGKTKHIPTDESYMEWDCTALFQATLFSETFALSDGHGKHHTLYQLYVKPRPSGSFHESVQSPTDNIDETTALALDQLRLLRNTLCHMETQEIDKTAFNYYIMLAKDAFTALGQDRVIINIIEKLMTEAFPIAKIQQLESKLEKENSVALDLKQFNNHLNEIRSEVGNQGASNKLQMCSYLDLFSLINEKVTCMIKHYQSDKRKKDLNILVSLLQELKMDVLEDLNGENQNVYCIILKVCVSDRPVYSIFTLDSQLKSSETDKNLNSDSMHVTSELGNSRDPNLFLFSSNDQTKKSPFVLLWKIPGRMEKKELSCVGPTLQESVHMLLLQTTFQKDYTEVPDFYMELTLPTCGCTISSLCSQIDILPLLVELELSKSHKECNKVDSVFNQSLMPMHVSYFLYRFSDQRQAEFVFDHLIGNLGKTLPLTEVQDVVICSVRNEAFFIFRESGSNSLSIVAEKESVTVKCRVGSQFESKCICSLVRASLENAMESLCHVVSLSMKSFLQLPCEEIVCGCCYKDVERETSCSGFASETWIFCACTSRRHPENILEGEHSMHMAQNKDEANIQPTDLGDDQVQAVVKPLWCILEYPGFKSGQTMPDIQASDSDDMSPSGSACFDESEQLNTSLLSVASTSSLSCPSSPSDPAYEISDLSQKILPASFDCSKSDLTSQEKSLQLSVGSNMLHECHVMRSSYEEDLSSVSGDVSDKETRKVQLLEATVECSPQEEHKHGTQSVHPSHNTGSQPQGTPDPSFSTVLQGGGKQTVTIDKLIRQLQSDVAFYQHQCDEVSQENIKLKEKLKQSEEEKQQLQGEVGRQLFLESKEKRSNKILQSSVEYVNEQSKSSTASGGTYAGMKGKLLGGAGPLQEPSFALQQRLQEISNSLSEAELNQMKSLARPKIKWTRLAKIREGFELFEELESRGEWSCTYVRELLKGIQRSDLLQKLDVPLADSAGSASCCPSDQMMLDKIPCKESPEEDSTSSPALVITPSGDKKLEAFFERRNDAADEPSDGMHLPGNEENDRDSGINESDSACTTFNGNSESDEGDIAVVPMNAHFEDPSSQSGSSAEEHTHFPDSSNGDFLSNESSSTAVNSSELSANSALMAQSFKGDSTSTSCTSQDVCNGSPRVMVGLSSAAKNCESSGDSSYSPKSSEDEILKSALLSDDSKECESRGMDTAESCATKFDRINEVSVWDGPMKPPHLYMRCAVGAGKDVVDSGALHSPDRVQRRVPGLMKDALPDGDIAVGHNASRACIGVGKDSAADHSVTGMSSQSNEWERLGARPRDKPPVKMAPLAPSLVDLVPQEVAGPVAHGVADAFLARHSQDRGLHESLYQGSVEKVLSNDTSSQGASYVDGMMNLNERNKAKPYVGECQAGVHSTLQFPFPPLLGGPYDSRNAGGGFPYNEQFNAYTGLVPGSSSSYFTGSNFLANGTFSSNSAFHSPNNNSFRSGFVLGTNRPQGMGDFDREPHSPLNGQVGWNFNTSMPTNFDNGSIMGATEPQPIPPVYGAQRFSGFNENTSIMASERQKTQTAWTVNSRLGNQTSVTANSDYLPSASTGNMARVDVGTFGLPAPHTVTRSNGLDNRHESEAESSRTLNTPRSDASNTSSDGAVAVANRDIGNRQIGPGLASDDSRVTRLVAGANANANPEPLIANTGGSMLNRDFGTDSVESTDNSLLELEQRVEEACALVERVFREREEREEFGREIERKEREIREQRARKRREREARELEEASRWPQQQEQITGRSQWLCEHYQRHCRVRFPCCSHFYSCHRCHNNSKACDNEEAKASHATHLKCSFCHHEQEIGEDSGKCRSCGAQMSAYFCSICKHFTSVDKNPYHCKKCGICRIHKDKSFHCDVCNVCLDKRLEGKHKCRADSGHDECCICLEDAFSGCQILPCSHKVHRECAIAMIQNGIRTCPVCRHPLYSPASD